MSSAITKKALKSSRKWCSSRERGSKGVSFSRRRRRAIRAGKIAPEDRKPLFAEVKFVMPGLLSKAWQKIRRMAARGT